MNRFFIELYLDEDVDVLVADLLRARGFVATTTRDAGKLQASDAEQMACAVGRQETLLTHNRADFEALARTYLATKSSGDTKRVPGRVAPGEQSPGATRPGTKRSGCFPILADCSEVDLSPP